MNKLNVRPDSLFHPAGGESEVITRWLNRKASRRLIVLISPTSEYTAPMRRIWELANATGSTVQLLGLCRDEGQKLSLRRELITMAALMHDASVLVETRIEIGTNWVEAVMHHYRLGDMIVYMADLRSGFWHQPLHQILESSMNAPVYILAGTRTSRQPAKGLLQVIAWSGFLGIIAGFFFLQVKIVQMPKDWFQTVLLIALLIPEIWLIWVWNSLFS